MMLDQKVTMTDGVKLSVNVFTQMHQEKPLPTIMSLSPYGIDQRYEDGAWFARHGYNYVRADVRGRGDSEGEFNSNESVASDAAALVAWIAAQSWCDGQVAMFGGSYEGLTQWQTMMGHPPALKTIIPLAAAAPGPGNTILAYMTQLLSSIQSRSYRGKLFVDWEYWNDKYYQRYAQHIPWAKLAEFTGSNDRTWKKWLAHPTEDDYWKSMAPTAEDYAKFDVPVLTVTSYFDLAQSGALAFYRDQLQHGSDSGKQKHYVLIGPWNHGGTMHPSQTLSGLDFGPQSVAYTDMKEFSLQWYDWVMKGGAKPEFLKKHITYYVMEENKWKYADSLDEVANGMSTWHLSSHDGGAGDVFHSGTLQQKKVSGKQQPDQYVSDPLKLISREEFLARPPNILNPNWLTDDSPAYQRDALVYHTPPLEHALDIAGNGVFEAYIELNVPDTDIRAWLFEIRPDGSPIWLAETFLRARYRHGWGKVEFATPGRIEAYNIYFPFFARRILPGSRLQLVVSGLNSPNYEKNYNSDGDLAWETDKDARTAVVRIYHDAQHPSALKLPIWEDKAAQRSKN
jgi:putative CocE/NonD family hydrolase